MRWSSITDVQELRRGVTAQLALIAQRDECLAQRDARIAQHDLAGVGAGAHQLVGAGDGGDDATTTSPSSAPRDRSANAFFSWAKSP